MLSFLAFYYGRSGELLLPYENMLGVELVEEKAGLATPKTPFIRLHFRDEKGGRQSITFAVHGWGLSGVKRDETIALFEELKRRTKYA